MGRRCSGLGFPPLQRMAGNRLCTVLVANGFRPHKRAEKIKINLPPKGVEVEAAGNAKIDFILYPKYQNPLGSAWCTEHPCVRPMGTSLQHRQAGIKKGTEMERGV